MDTEGILAAGCRGLWADPYLWSCAGGLFAGAAAGLCLRALLSPSASSDRRRSSRFARAIVYLSLGILCAAGLLVLADKGGLAEAWSTRRGVFLVSCGAAFFAGACAGLRPVLLGLPLAGLLAAFLAFLGIGISGWLPLRSAEGPAQEIARLLPYKVDGSSFSGQLALLERDSVPVIQDLSLASSSAGLKVEGLELREPLRLAALLVSSRVRAAQTGWEDPLALYRISGIVGSSQPPGDKGGQTIALDFPGPKGLALVDAVLKLPAGEGAEPGSPPARRSILFGLAVRTRSSGTCVSLLPLQPVAFDLSLPGFAAAPRRGR